ncbi:MAG: squalene/phytoene synthase family protein, partial [Nitrosospira sp.]|nr:squalene/phytoene synthase family protein [Nitrosospira sp.]
MLPADVRDQMGLSYLFARAADTIADTDLIDRERRLKYL